MTRNT